MVNLNSPPPDPQESCAHILRAVRYSGLTWGTQETPYSLFLTIRKKFLKDAKTALTARSPTHSLGVDRGDREVEQLLASNQRNLLTIQNLESGNERLKADLEGEVINNEKLSNALTVSKELVNSLNTKYAEARDQINKSAQTFSENDNSAKALKEAKEEIVRLNKKSNESLKTISKLRERTVFSEEDYTKILQQKYRLENQLQEAVNKADLAEEEADMHKEETKKLSKKITSLMILLNNTQGSKEALERHISDKSVLESNSSTSSSLVSAAKPMTKKELKKLRQKTKKRLENMQAKESDIGDDEDLNSSVEALIDPSKKNLDPNDNCDEGNNNINPLDTQTKVFPKLFAIVEGTNESINVIKTLSTVSDHDHTDSPPVMASSNEPSQAATQAVVQVESPSNDSPAVQAGDSTVLRKTETSQLPHAAARPETPSNASTAVCGGDPGEKSSTEDREVLLKLVTARVREIVESDLDTWFRYWGLYGFQVRVQVLRIELIKQREQRTGMPSTPSIESKSGEVPGEITDEEIMMISRFYLMVLENSVCEITNFEEREISITPPWGVLGLGHSLKDVSFNSYNYLSHHAVGHLAEQLVRRGLLDAGNGIIVGGEIAGWTEEQTSSTQHPAVEAKSE